MPSWNVQPRDPHGVVLRSFPLSGLGGEGVRKYSPTALGCLVDWKGSRMISFGAVGGERVRKLSWQDLISVAAIVMIAWRNTRDILDDSYSQSEEESCRIQRASIQR